MKYQRNIRGVNIRGAISEISHEISREYCRVSEEPYQRYCMKYRKGRGTCNEERAKKKSHERETKSHIEGIKEKCRMKEQTM